MTESEFLEKFYDLVGEYCYKNDKFEDIDDGKNIEYSYGGKFCVTINIERTNDP